MSASLVETAWDLMEERLWARFSKPSQALWLVSPKHGVAAQWPVYL